MKFCFIICSLLVLSLGIISSAQEYPPTPAQKHFTAIIKGLPGVVSTEWVSPVSLWVKASGKAVGSTEVAQQLSDMLAERGRTALMQPFCVYIYQKKGEALGRSCVYY